MAKTSLPDSSSWDFLFGRELHTNRAQGLAFQFRMTEMEKRGFFHGGIHNNLSSEDTT